MKGLQGSVKRSLEALARPEEEIATYPELLFATFIVVVGAIVLFAILILAMALLMGTSKNTLIFQLNFKQEQSISAHSPSN